jgi:hypothetical protein
MWCGFPAGWWLRLGGCRGGSWQRVERINFFSELLTATKKLCIISFLCCSKRSDAVNKVDRAVL